MNKEFEKTIEKVVELVRRPKDKLKGDDWSRVTQEDEDELRELFRSIIEARFGQDYKGSTPFEFTLVNRNKQEHMGFLAVPYAHKNFEGFKRCTEFNLSVAFGRWDTLKRL